MDEGHIDKAKEGWDRKWEVRMDGEGGLLGGTKWRQLYLNDIKKKNQRNLI